MDPVWASASEIAQAVSAGSIDAATVIEETIAVISARDPILNAFTTVTDARALARAQALDSRRAQGRALGPLAGVPFAVKNLFDVAGLPTLAGSKINRENTPASRDAPLIERLEAAGAVLVGALNMGEYAYDFTGENVHDGPSRNPHDLTRMTGGSSGGSGGAVAGGLVPIALGSDTNGSIRVPSSLCGIFGLKPTYGRLSRARSFRSCRASIISGPSRADTRDLALSYDAMQGFDADDPGCVDRAGRAVAAGLRAGNGRPAHRGRRRLFPQGRLSGSALPRSTGSPKALNATRRSRFREVGAARAGGLRHHHDRRRRVCISTGCASAPRDFDPAVRDRFIAGAMVPATLRRQGAEIPPLVSRRKCWRCSRTSTPFWRRRRRARRPRSASRPSCSTASSCRCGPISASTPSRSRSSACRSSRCRCRSSRCRSGCRSSPRRGGKTSRCESRNAWRRRVSWPRRDRHY